MAVIGYARVSSEGQNLNRQEDALKEKGAEKVFTDKLSGKDTKRPGLAELLAYVREGDTVYILSFDRLARSLTDLLNLVEQLKKKRVRLVSIKENVDTGTAQGKLQLALFGALAEFQRETIGEQRDEGIKAAKQRGVKFGRPKMQKPDGWQVEVRRWRQGRQTAVETYNKLGMSKSMFYKMVREEEQGQGKKRREIDEQGFIKPSAEEEEAVMKAFGKGLEEIGKKAE